MGSHPESEKTAREITFWSLWDNYTAAYKNEIMDALIAEEGRVSDYDRLLHTVWGWVIRYCDSGYDIDDLIYDLERGKHECPGDLKES